MRKEVISLTVHLIGVTLKPLSEGQTFKHNSLPQFKDLNNGSENIESYIKDGLAMEHNKIKNPSQDEE